MNSLTILVRIEKKENKIVKFTLLLLLIDHHLNHDNKMKATQHNRTQYNWKEQNLGTHQYKKRFEKNSKEMSIWTEMMTNLILL